MKFDFLKNKLAIAIICFFTDVLLCVWSYFRLTDYKEYTKVVSTMIDSPDFQLQVYQIFLQSVTFTMLLFILFHAGIYYFFWKEKKAAQKYLRIYCALAALSCLIMIFSQIYWGVVPAIIYGAIYREVNQSLV